MLGYCPKIVIDRGDIHYSVTFYKSLDFGSIFFQIVMNHVFFISKNHCDNILLLKIFFFRITSVSTVGRTVKETSSKWVDWKVSLISFFLFLYFCAFFSTAYLYMNILLNVYCMVIIIFDFVLITFFFKLNFSLFIMS